MHDPKLLYQLDLAFDLLLRRLKRSKFGENSSIYVENLLESSIDFQGQSDAELAKTPVMTPKAFSENLVQ